MRDLKTRDEKRRGGLWLPTTANEARGPAGNGSERGSESRLGPLMNRARNATGGIVCGRLKTREEVASRDVGTCMRPRKAIARAWSRPSDDGRRNKTYCGCTAAYCACCGLFDNARRSRSATVFTLSFSMMFARCASTVLMLMPRSSAICLFRRPAMMRSST
jgi:hypothetical protein